MTDEEHLENLVTQCEDCDVSLMDAFRKRLIDEKCSISSCIGIAIIRYKDVSEDKYFCADHLDLFKAMVTLSTDARIDYHVVTLFKNNRRYEGP
jgi:hypothetical protein